MEHLPGTVLEVRYDRNGTPYRHEFKPGVRQRLNPDGSVTLYHPSRRIWANDRWPGFWQKYGDRHGANPPRRGSAPTMKINWWLVVIAGVVLYKMAQAQPVGNTSGLPIADILRTTD